jgi:uncharacterized OsmC-like protein
MTIVLNAENDLTLQDFSDGELRVHAHDPEVQFGALEMFATSLGLCTFSVVAGYGIQLGVDPSDVTIRLRWRYTEGPRISDIEMDVAWPSLPRSRLGAAQRAAAKCTLHNTLETPARIVTRVTPEGHPPQAEA